ncbi:hypothetical protein BK658_02090 [Pseudomonas brassicacearum]|uniref:Gfo/Idh/MocA-like oxidoreductase N-terminal domain-containing protein n=1 Tax=Pseudomonas brassicacearum TaxID=930166 RepID=A0A423H1D1_9PSED|nr:hypothetical protein BK658_02090 [Pseudomonas brassicacearum]
MNVVRWGMIGCGSVAERKSGPAFYKAPGSALVAVMGRRLEAVQDYAARHGIERFYTDAESLIADPEVDAVYIATPPDSHHAYSLLVAAAGKPDASQVNRCSSQRQADLQRKQCGQAFFQFAAET